MKRMPIYMLFLVLVGGAASTYIVSSQDKPSELKTEKYQEYDPALDVLFITDATGPTLRDRMRSELSKGVPRPGSEYMIYSSGMELIPDQTSDGTPVERLKQVFAHELVESDLVIRGSVVGSESKLTRDDRFIFTVHRVNVSRILFERNHVDNASSLEVIQRGGAVSLDGYTVRHVINDCLPLDSVSGDVVLFLKRVPASTAFHLSSLKGSFGLRGSNIVPLSKTPAIDLNAISPEELEDILLSQIRESR